MGGTGRGWEGQGDGGGGRERGERVGKTIKVRRIIGKTAIVISKIANKIKVFKFCLLNVCERECGI
jgi:hypothetical protein